MKSICINKRKGEPCLVDNPHIVSIMRLTSSVNHRFLRHSKSHCNFRDTHIINRAVNFHTKIQIQRLFNVHLIKIAQQKPIYGFNYVIKSGAVSRAQCTHLCTCRRWHVKTNCVLLLMYNDKSMFSGLDLLLSPSWSACIFIRNFHSVVYKSMVTRTLLWKGASSWSKLTKI